VLTHRGLFPSRPWRIIAGDGWVRGLGACDVAGVDGGDGREDGRGPRGGLARPRASAWGRSTPSSPGAAGCRDRRGAATGGVLPPLRVREGPRPRARRARAPQVGLPRVRQGLRRFDGDGPRPQQAGQGDLARLRGGDAGGRLPQGVRLRRGASLRASLFMRHRLCEVMARTTPALRARRGCGVLVDGLAVPDSPSGNHSRSAAGFSMPRPPRRRGATG
jgi:hypothetical protein